MAVNSIAAMRSIGVRLNLTLVAAFLLGTTVAAAELNGAETPAVVVSEEPSLKSPALSVCGSVKNEQGEPISGATVLLRGNWRGIHLSGALPHERDVLARTTTNADGEYRFKNVGAPPWMTDVLDGLRQGRDGAQVIVWADGCGVQWKPISSFEATDVDFQLEPEADVSGMLTDEDGTPIESGTIAVVGYTKATDGISGMYDSPAISTPSVPKSRFVRR